MTNFKRSRVNSSQNSRLFAEQHMLRVSKNCLAIRYHEPTKQEFENQLKYKQKMAPYMHKSNALNDGPDLHGRLYPNTVNPKYLLKLENDHKRKVHGLFTGELSNNDDSLTHRALMLTIGSDISSTNDKQNDGDGLGEYRNNVANSILRHKNRQEQRSKNLAKIAENVLGQKTTHTKQIVSTKTEFKIKQLRDTMKSLENKKNEYHQPHSVDKQSRTDAFDMIDNTAKQMQDQRFEIEMQHRVNKWNKMVNTLGSDYLWELRKLQKHKKQRRSLGNISTRVELHSPSFDRQSRIMAQKEAEHGLWDSDGYLINRFKSSSNCITTSI